MHQNEKPIGQIKQGHYKSISDILKSFCAAENQLINISSEFLALLATLSQQKQNNHLPDLYQYLFKGMRELHNQGLRADYPPRLMEKACYVLCAAFDEEIMNSHWGQAACWENQTLVSGLFKQRNSGEFFFILMEQALQNSSRMIDFIELQYLLLRLGFKGQYANTEEHKLAELASHIFDVICKHRQSQTNHTETQANAPYHTLQQWSPIKLLPPIVILLFIVAILSHVWIRFENEDYGEPLEPLLHNTMSVNLSR